MTVLTILLLALALLGIGAVLGMTAIDGYWSRERARLSAREARVNALWRSLQANQRIHLALFVARRRMQEEADRQVADRESQG